MKKFLILFLFVLAGNSFLFPQKIYKTIPNPVEGIEWGMSYDDVMDERDDLQELNSSVCYEDAINDGRSERIFYHFKNNQLYMIAVFYEDYSMNYIKDFEKIEKEKIFEEYGRREWNYEWIKDQYKGKPDMYELAVKFKELVISTTTELMGGKIIHSLANDGDENEIQHSLIYVSTDYSE